MPDHVEVWAIDPTSGYKLGHVESTQSLGLQVAVLATPATVE
jgi:hypothetical protein